MTENGKNVKCGGEGGDDVDVDALTLISALGNIQDDRKEGIPRPGGEGGGGGDPGDFGS